MKRFACAAALLFGGAAFAAPSAPAGREIKQPSTKVGPYRVTVDRISPNRTVTLEYATSPTSISSYNSRRTVQLQVAVMGDDASAVAGLATFQIKTVTVERKGRAVELPYYGGPMENPNDPAIVRAYIYVPGLPAAAEELRSLEGEIVSYDRTAPFEVELPLDGMVPKTVEKDGVKVTLRELSWEGGIARFVLWVDAPPNTVIVNTTNDGSYGVSLFNEKDRSAPPAAGTMVQVRSNQAEYRMSYHSVQGTPNRIRLQFLHRGGSRKVYPFRVERIPVPYKR
jgi:hypothetical protein